MNGFELDGTLGRGDLEELRRRKRAYEGALEEAGYEVHLATDPDRRFAALVVVDPDGDRRGLLGPEGGVQWLDELDHAAVGALARFVVSGVQDEIDRELGPGSGL